MPMRKGPTCFNCTGSHNLRECPEPWNNARIAENRKAMIRKGLVVSDYNELGNLKKRTRNVLQPPKTIKQPKHNLYDDSS